MMNEKLEKHCRSVTYSYSYTQHVPTDYFITSHLKNTVKNFCSVNKFD